MFHSWLRGWDVAGSTRTLMRSDFGWFDQAFRDGVRASCEAMFPVGHAAPSHLDVQLAPRLESHVRRLPPSQRRLVALMFIAVELAAPVLMPGWGRFSRRTPERRLRDLQALCDRPYPLYLIATALRAQVGMLYLTHPATSAFMGEYKVTARPDDPYQIATRPQAGVFVTG
jgi:hypothetical protein